jgi:type 1 glutamine amidotransferase
MLNRFAILLIFLILSAPPMGLPAARPIRVLLITGGHPHPISFYSVFAEDVNLTVTVNPHPSSYSNDLAEAYDVLVLYDLFDVETEPDRSNLRRFLASHKGLVVLHHALADNQDWPWWFENVVGGRYLMRPEGKLTASRYAPNTEMRLRVVGQHPITSGIPDFTVRDEAYNDVWVSPRVKVLIQTDSPDSMAPIAWISPYEASRVVYIELGHGPEIFGNQLYRRLVHNAIEWAASAPP